MHEYKWLDSVYSDGSRFFISDPYPKSGDTIEIKLRVKTNDDIEGVYLREYQFGASSAHEMKLVETKDGMDYYACEVKVVQSVFRYKFVIATKDSIFYYNQQQITDYIPNKSRDFKILVNYDAPKWAKSTVFYQIYPDRFYSARDDLGVKEDEYTLDGYKPRIYSSPEEPALDYDEGRNIDFYNGDLYGIIEKLDYLEDLGVNAIYLNPIFTSPSSHKFDTLDFFEVDPHLGGDEAFAELMQALHERDMRLVLDVSIDHTGIDAKWFNRDGVYYPKDVGAYNNPDSKEREYYRFGEDNSYEGWLGVETMPKLNFESESLRNILYKDEDSMVKHWLKEPYNIDGWRFDVAANMAHERDHDLYYEVWQELYDEIKKTNPEAMILAEDWSDCYELFLQNGYDSTMNYFGFGRPVRELLGQGDHFNNQIPALQNKDYKFSARQFAKRTTDAMSEVSYQITLQQFDLFNSHDLPRVYNDPKVNFEEYLGSVIILFTFPGTVNYYYGDERLLDGRPDSVEGARFAMRFDEIESEKAQYNFNMYKTLSKLKTTEPALIDGGFKYLYVDGKALSYARFSDEKAYLVVFSAEDEAKTVSIDISNIGYHADDKVKEVFSEDIDYEFAGDNLVIEVPAHKTYLLELSK